jgi:hypothetical protein
MAKRFREARVKAGLPEDLVLYCGRHDYGTRILKRTGNLAAVIRTMGHRDVKTAMQYQHPDLEIVRAALDQDTTGRETGVAGLSYGTLYGTIPTSGLSRVRGEPNRREPIIRESPLVPRDVSPGIVLVATRDD